MSIIVWFFILTCITRPVSMHSIAQEQPDITLLTLYESNMTTLTCVGGANTYNSALTFLTPFEPKYAEKTPKSKYHFHNKTVSKSSYNCKFDDICAMSWNKSGHIVKKYDTDYITPITDERWENFKIKYTDSNELKKISYKAHEQYLTVSVRSEFEVRIHLCDEANGNLQCYVISIPDKKQQSKTRIEDCTSSVKKTLHSQFKCKELQTGQGAALTDGLWGHYTITAELVKQNIKVFKLGQEKPVLEYTEQSRSISKLFISSQAGAFWKIHSYNYLQLHATDLYKTIGPPYQARSTGTMCLSFYVAVCSTCTLHIAINDNELKTIHGVTDGQVKWQNVRFFRNVLENQNYSLQIKGTNINRTTKDFWAIDDIRECIVKESRKITTEVMNNNNEETVFCQTLNFPAWMVSNNGNIPDNPDTFFCKTLTNIGRNCDIPCESVDPNNEPYCNKNRICKPTQTGNETLCACALGYKGTRCNEPCTNRKYGYNCQHDCGYCKDNCLKSSGNCSNGCENGYEGPLCTTLLYPILKTAPTFVSSTLTNITVRLDNIGTEGKQPAVKFQIQYTTNTKESWINYSERRTLEPLTEITIENLDPEKNYAIRAVLFTSDGHSYQGLRVPNVTAFTNCAGVYENADAITDITFTPTSNSINLQWKPVCRIHIVLSVICIDSWCNINHSQNYTANSTTNEYTFTGLLPYTSHEIHVSSDRQTFVLQKIKTQANIPPSVRNLTVYSRDEEYLALRWKSPFPPYGELEHYKLTYKKCDSQEDQSVQVIKPTPCNIWDNFLCYTITNVEGYHCYDIDIRAKNTNITDYSLNSWVQGHTRQDSSQAPRNLTANWNDQDELILNWTHPFVTNGNLSSFVILFESTDGNKYNYNDTYILNDEKKIYTYKIQKSIRLSTKYNLTICGMNKYVGKSTSITIVTPPATPALMGNITAGERTNTTQVITIPSIDKTMTDNHGDMYVVVCDPKQHTLNISIKPASCKQNITKQTNCSGTAWIAAILPVNTTSTSITVGNNTTASNKPLQPDIDYLVSVVLVNYYNSECRYRAYTLTTLTPIVKPQEHYTNPALYALLLLVLLPIIAWFIYRGILRSKRSSPPNDKQNFNLSEFKMSAKVKSTIKESDTTITQPLLQNIADGQSKVYSCIVQIGNLAVYVKQSIENGELKRQHDLFPKGPTKPWDYGMLKENKQKNRYANISAYDETRVVLDKIQDDPYSDFINANYIDGYQQTKAYIATQGPKISTVNDFWRMIWQENVNCIVMLANIIENNKKKCEQYWPENGNTKTYLNIQVSFTSSEVYADYEFRTFLVKCGEENREIKQLHFTSWPDHSVPLYPQTLVPFVKKLLTFSTKNQPIVVHCSAGVGRTGTIILCDICLRMAAKEKAIDVVYYLKKMREQRVNMVDNIDQYNLVHMVLLECLTAPDTNISCQNLSARVDQWISQKEIQKQMTYLKNTAWYYRMMAGKITDGNIRANVTKNRFTEIVPETKRIYLTRYPVQDEHSDYINAVPVDGFRFKEQFIATQIPLPHTVGDFWRMVDEQNVGVILSLNEIDINDKTSYSFWPTEHGIINPVPYLHIKYKSVTGEILYDKYTVQLENKNPKGTQNEKFVTIIQLKSWKREQIIPNNVNDLLSLLGETETLFRRNTPVVICCYDGSTGCGLFIALSFIIEKIKLEKNVDVCMAVREIRKNRIRFVNDERQFQFLYEAAVAYVQSFEIYSNFQ